MAITTGGPQSARFDSGGGWSMRSDVLCIVSRDRPELLARLREQFGDIEILFDRRAGERRRHARPTPYERRRGERRVRDVGPVLSDRGWAFVDRRRPERAPAARTFRAGDAVMLARYDPMLPQRLVGAVAVVKRVTRIRALVQFEGEQKQRYVHLADLEHVGAAQGALPIFGTAVAASPTSARPSAGAANATPVRPSAAASSPTPPHP
jgi:hypothetical protein